MKLSILAALALAAASVSYAQDIAGDWQGTLKAGPAELRLVVHITKSGDTYSGTMDSIDQGARGIPLSSIALKDSKLTFEVPSIQGSYEGTVAKDANSISGTWTQAQSLPLDLKRGTGPTAAEPKPAAPSDIDGPWHGTLDAGGTKLRLVLHIVNTENGLTATLDSLDQGANGIPATSVTRTGASLKVGFKQIAGSFEGTINPDKTRIEGTWTQAGNSMPLVLERGPAAKLKRPQDPARPYPYRDEEVSYENKTAGITLAATLTIPRGAGPFPAAVLITGSGPQNRDEELMDHRPFLVLADYLTRHGIAVLRADDRGVGQSTGVFKNATTADFATDAEAGVAYLKTRPEIDARRIGLIGHSEGGVIAPMVAARNRDVAFIVMMAGTGVPGAEVLATQRRLITAAEGLKEVPAAAQKTPDTPWFKFFLSYDPATALRNVHCPVLVINGSKDLQVSPEQNLPAIRAALQESGNRDVEIDELPGLNHLFQTAKTGAPTEYSQIQETMSPVALDKIASWILAHTREAVTQAEKNP